MARMTGSRRGKGLAERRRRASGDDDEDDHASVSSGNSEGSVQSELSVFDKDQVDNSDVSSDPTSNEVKDARADVVNTGKQGNNRDNTVADPKHMSTDSAVVIPAAAFDVPTDTAIMNDLANTADVTAEAASYEDLEATLNGSSNAPASRNESIAERRRREHDEYRQKRDSDPTFVPNRGNFFMHDARSAKPKSAEGRTKSGSFGKQSSRRSPLIDSKWTHDLHEALNEPLLSKPASRTNPARPQLQGQRPASGPRRQNLSTLRHVGNAQISVNLPGMQATTKVAGKIYSHTKLPDVFPWLRRGKAVRVALPSRVPIHVLPPDDRTFAFVSQRSSRKQSLRSQAALGALSRRNSTQTSSRNSISLAGSGNSSITHDDLANAKPVVLLPRAAEKGKGLTTHRPDPPQAPHVETHRENSIMHQPSPQKGFAVNDIDAQATLSLDIPRENYAQPFENQLPREYQYSHYSASTASHSDMPSAIDPYQTMSAIPYGPIHAPNFLPPDQMAGPGYYSMPYAPAPFHQQPMPSFTPQSTYGPDAGYTAVSRNGAGTVAHESNGMIYYIEPGQMPVSSQMWPPSPGGYAIPATTGGSEIDSGMAAQMYYPPTDKGGAGQF